MFDVNELASSILVVGFSFYDPPASLFFPSSLLHKVRDPYTIYIGMNSQLPSADVPAYGPTFVDYLNAAVGPLINKTFVFVGVDVIGNPNYETLWSAVDRGAIDILFGETNVFVCLALAYGARPMLSIVRLVKPSNQPAQESTDDASSVYMHVGRSDINTWADLANKRVAMVRES